ncbi:hypothetical protein HPB51_024515 [Rhipicephalus microplus]|uniref:Prolyl 4-hydroxylase alpha subunit domain-containing protein n=1 Tax=Rhipicephalus microplus TaxID=6941 RepID=A0A9J6EDJ4_RHIMP|nr:hypothetical protein HPB51_024515 [Rhipicephalus microplus]
MLTIPISSLCYAIITALLSFMGIEDTPQVPALTRLEAVRLSAQRKLVRDPVCSTKGREDKFCLWRGMERRDRQLEGVCSAARSEADNTSFSTSDIGDADSGNSSRGQPTCPKASDQLPHCDGTFLDAGVRLVRDEDCLNGPQRLVADGFLTQEECATLLKLSETAISGSGYGKRFPNTKYEDFSGVTLKNLKQQLEKSTIDVSAAKLVLLTAERSRLYVEAYFRLKRRLHAHFVHLACRNATERSTTNRTDMSHVIHSDNCQFQQNGSCPAIRKDLVAREFSAAVYLNDDVHGGEMVLATTPRTSIRGRGPSVVYLDGVLDDAIGLPTVSTGGGSQRQWRATCPAIPQAKQMGLLSGVLQASERRPSSDGGVRERRCDWWLLMHRRKGFSDLGPNDVLEVRCQSLRGLMCQWQQRQLARYLFADEVLDCRKQRLLAVIPPKCGRIVALNSRNPHGVLPVFRGRRCALLTWMTYQRDVEDPDLSECRKMLGFDDGYSPNVGQYNDAYKSG